MSLLSIILSTQPRRPDVGGGATVVPDDTAYLVGETITVTVTGGPGAAANAVGLYVSGDNPLVDLPIDWKYLESNDQDLPASGVANGVVTFATSSVAPGSYVAHLLDEGFGAASAVGWGYLANGAGFHEPDVDAALITVTTLNDSGAGSLREALEASGKRYITFSPSLTGYITLSSRITATSGQFTLDGSGASVCVRGPAGVDTACVRFDVVSDFVVRQFRCGVGDGTLFSQTRDSMHIRDCANGYFENCEFFWGTDGTCELTTCSNLTFKDCLIAHTLSLADHVDVSAPTTIIRHSFASLLFSGTDRITFYRCIWLHNTLRNPQLSDSAQLEMVNCIAAGWTNRALTLTGALPQVDLIGNLYLQTTETSPYISPIQRHPVNVDTDTVPTIYIDDCWGVNNTSVPTLRWPINSGGDPWNLVSNGAITANTAGRSITRLATSPAPPSAIPANTLWAGLQLTAGKTLPWRIPYTTTLLDDVDAMIARDRECTFGIIDGLVASLGGGTELLGAYPTMAGLPPGGIFEVAGGPAGTFFGDLASATRDISHTFAADANYCVVLLSYEESITVNSVTIDPAGAAVAMTQLGSPVVNSISTAVVYYAHGLSLSGVKTIRVVTSAAEYITIEATSWRNADNETPAPTGTALLTGTSASIPLTGVNPDGHLVLVANVNSAPTINPGGGITINRQDNSPVDGWQGVTASQAPPLSPSATPSLSLSSSQRIAARAFVVNPTGGTPPPPAVLTVQRLIVLTDIGGDPDDQQSMRRLMLYSNELDIVGLIAGSAGTPGETDPTPRPDLINAIISDYAADRPNLIQHDPNYPTSATLSAAVKVGNEDREAWGTAGDDTEGSNHIISMVDASNELTHIAIWGGSIDLLQALDSAENRRGKSAPQFAAFVAKLVVYDINDQTPGLAATIRSNFPDLLYCLCDQPTGTNGMYRGFYQSEHGSIDLVPPADASLNQTQWVTDNVVNGHGALGADYPNDIVQNPTTLRGVKEGDTPSWLYILHPGMQNPLEPGWGGWGGRFAQISSKYWHDNALENSPPHFNGSTDSNARRKYAVARWRKEHQLDFQARMDWCRTGTYSSVSHHPIAAVNNDTTKTIVFRTVSAGSVVALSAIGSTTDLGSTSGLTYNWMYYQEVTGGPAVTITNPNSRDASFTAPAAGNELHFILTVRNSGSPAPVLAAYRRVVITVE